MSALTTPATLPAEAWKVALEALTEIRDGGDDALMTRSDYVREVLRVQSLTRAALHRIDGLTEVRS